MKQNVTVIIGHTASQVGAQSFDKTVSEYGYNSNLSKLIAMKLNNAGFDCSLIDKTGLDPATIKYMVNVYRPICLIELHCNGYNNTVKGTEVLYTSTNEQSRVFAYDILEKLYIALNRKDNEKRGAKCLQPDARGYFNLVSYTMPSIITEAFFVDNVEDLKLGLESSNDIAQAICEGVVAFTSRPSA